MKNDRKIPLILSVVALSILIGLILCVKINPLWFKKMDSAIYTTFTWPQNQIITMIVRYFAKLATIGPTLGLAFFFAIYVWQKNYHLLALWNVFNIFAVSGAGYILKNVIARTRPDVWQVETRTSYSFPSGHSLLAFAFFLSVILSLSVLWDRRKVRRIALILTGYPLLIACTRIYLRVHYPSDILAGFALSALVVFLSYAGCISFIPSVFQVKSNPRKKQHPLFTKKQKIILVLLSLVFVIILTRVIYELGVYSHFFG